MTAFLVVAALVAALIPLLTIFAGAPKLPTFSFGNVLACEHGALGTGAVVLRNLPPPNTFRINAVDFSRSTSRNRKSNGAIAWPGYGLKVRQKIDATGIVGRLLIYFTGTFTQPAVAGVPTNQWPWNVIKNLTVSANGINNLISCDGTDLRVLARVRNPFFFDRESAFTPAAATLPFTVKLLYEVPLAFDDESLMGAVFAQTEDTNLNVEITTGAAAELWTVAGNAPVVTAAQFVIVPEFYSIPYEDTQAGRIAVIPDLRQMHGIVAKDDQNALAVGDVVTNLMRTGGILLRTLQRFDNIDAGSLDVSAAVTAHKFRYGSNVIPLEVPGIVQRWENEKDYGDKMLPAADYVTSGPANYFVDDFVRDNALRDVIHLLGVTEPQLINAVAAGTVINAGNNVHTVQEHMTVG